MMSARGSANLLSRLTAFTATLFMVMSIVLTISASVSSDKNILESLPNINSTENGSRIFQQNPQFLKIINLITLI